MMKRHRDSFRRAFTLVELLVVMAIIAVLAALIGAGVMSWVSGQARRNSESHIRSVYNALSRQWDQVVTDAKTEALPSGVTDRNVWIRTRLIEAFPVSFAEVNAAYATAPLSTIPANRRKYMANYKKTLAAMNAGAHQVKTESAACLLMALAVDRSGGGYNPDSFKAMAKDVDADGITEFVDGWGEPLYFFRFPDGTSADLTSSRPTNFVATSIDVPVIVSAGADSQLGMNLPTANTPTRQDMTITSTQFADDNIYSFKIK